MNNETSFWNYLKNNKISIPVIQRDYAQGRIGKENLRMKFLSSIKDALDGKFKEGEDSLKLDFVYGSEEEGQLYPLDGQQRLTTLWLLHWFIAYKADELSQDNRDILNRFTYKTRRSSTDFCETLSLKEMPKSKIDIINFIHGLSYENINKQPEQPDKLKNKIVEVLKKDDDPKQFVFKQDVLLRKLFISNTIDGDTSFFSKWQQDPTVQGMLRMLSGSYSPDKGGVDIIDGLEELFIGTPKEKFKEYWRKLTQVPKAPIMFYQLPMHIYGLSDDLYIKMNARGKQLTDFENMKADIIGYISEKIEENPNDNSEETLKAKERWNKLMDPVEGLPIKIDTDFTDIFWGYNMKSPGNIDDIFFAFINRFFFNHYLKNIKDENDSYYAYFTGKGDNAGDRNISYQNFDNYKWRKPDEKGDEGEVPVEFFENLSKVLTRFKQNGLKNEDFQVAFAPNFRFIPEYEEYNNDIKPSPISLPQRVLFYALCKYFLADNFHFDAVKLKRWMRVVYNLISVRAADGVDSIRSFDTLKNAIETIDLFTPDLVYEELWKMKDTDIKGLSSTFREQMKEEVEKVKQILDEKGDLQPYPGEEFKTWEDAVIAAESIAFFKGTIRFLFHDHDGNVDWEHFPQKMKFAKNNFKNNKETKQNLLRNFIYLITDNDRIYEVCLDGTDSSWLNILTNTKFQEHVDTLLTMELLTDEELSQQTSKIPNFPGLAKAHKDLFGTPLLDYLRNETFFLHKDPYRVNRPGRRTINICYVGATRNPLFVKGIKEGKIGISNDMIISGQPICDKGFFWGLSIDFTYKSLRFPKRLHNFRWYWKREKQKEGQVYRDTLDVYLMSKDRDGNLDYKQRNPQLHEYGGTDREKYYCSNVPSDCSQENFYEILDGLIEERNHK